MKRRHFLKQFAGTATILAAGPAFAATQHMETAPTKPKTGHSIDVIVENVDNEKYLYDEDRERLRAFAKGHPIKSHVMVFGKNEDGSITAIGASTGHVKFEDL